MSKFQSATRYNVGQSRYIISPIACFPTPASCLKAGDVQYPLRTKTTLLMSIKLPFALAQSEVCRYEYEDVLFNRDWLKDS